jgi:hypothetical protein
MIFGAMLLLVGLGLGFLGQMHRADGTRVVPYNDWTFALYPVMCLTFLAFGAAFVIANL